VRAAVRFLAVRLLVDCRLWTAVQGRRSVLALRSTPFIEAGQQVVSQVRHFLRASFIS